jgi:hypothetical protein
MNATPDQLPLLEVQPTRQRRTRPAAARPAPGSSGPVIYRRWSRADECEQCWTEQVAAHQAGAEIPHRHAARWQRRGGGLPEMLLCATHKQRDEDKHTG